MLATVPRVCSNPLRVAALRRRCSLKVHLGCGDDRLEGFVNVDCRMTRATDVTTDLNEPQFARHSVALAFSHAFFEHLYRDARARHLQRIHASLEPDGVCCYIGMPYFRNVARFYLDGSRAPQGRFLISTMCIATPMAIRSRSLPGGWRSFTKASLMRLKLDPY